MDYHEKTDTDAVLIEGVEGFEGTWEVDTRNLTGFELRTIKRVSGVRAGELPEAMIAGDYDLTIAFAVIALERAQHAHARVAERVLLGAEAGAVIFLPRKREESGLESPDPTSGPPPSDGPG